MIACIGTDTFLIDFCHKNSVRSLILVYCQSSLMCDQLEGVTGKTDLGNFEICYCDGWMLVAPLLNDRLMLIRLLKFREVYFIMNAVNNAPLLFRAVLRI